MEHIQHVATRVVRGNTAGTSTMVQIGELRCKTRTPERANQYSICLSDGSTVLARKYRTNVSFMFSSEIQGNPLGLDSRLRTVPNGRSFYADIHPF